MSQAGSLGNSGGGGGGITGTTLQYDVIVGNGPNLVTSVGPGSVGQVLQSGGNAANPAYSTATYPSTTTANQILYSSATNTVSEITAVNDAVLITSNSGVPSLLANGTTGQVLTATTGSPPSWASAGGGSGTVTSVSGTANQVAVATGTTTPVISLIGPYTPSTYTAHGVLIGEGTSSIAALGSGTAGQILQSGGAIADPSYSTSTYPSTNAVSTLLYASSVNVMSALATANNGTLITSATGVPSWLANGTTGQILTATTGSPPSWDSGGGGIGGTVTQYDVIVGVNSTTVASVGPGTLGQILQSGGNAANPAYSTATYPLTTVSNQLLYSSATNTVSGLAVPSIPGTRLQWDGTNVSWFNPLQQSFWFDDFIYPGTQFGAWIVNNSNGASQFALAIDSGHPGCVQLQSGTSSNGICHFTCGSSSNGQGEIILGGGTVDIYWIINIPVLSNGTDRFNLSIGLNDQNQSGGFDYGNNGCTFDYSDNLNSGNWRLTTNKAGTSTHVNSSTAVSTSWVTLRININSAGTLVTFYVNGTSIGTSTTNIPTLGISPYVTFAKTLGTTQVVLNLDVYYHFINLTSPR